MATNNFKPFANGASANVTSQADYEALAALLTGFQSGKASSAQINKAIRQSTVMAYVLAQFISDSAVVDVLDNGTPATILANLKAGMTKLTPGRIMGPPQVISATGLYTKTPGTRNVLVELVGAGGGGGGVSATPTGSLAIGGGGGGGGYALGFFDVSAVTTVSCVVGLGGTGGVGDTNANGGGLTGTKGGTTSFGTLLQATGGDGGPGNGTATSTSGSITQKVGALGGTGTLGLINADGSAGGQGLITNSSNSIAGYGGSSNFSGAVRAAFGGSAAGNNGKSGSGGSGALSDGSPTIRYNGGNGGNGLIKITELA